MRVCVACARAHCALGPKNARTHIFNAILVELSVKHEHNTILLNTHFDTARVLTSRARVCTRLVYTVHLPAIIVPFVLA
jgi:hypothetical protein